MRRAIESVITRGVATFNANSIDLGLLSAHMSGLYDILYQYSSNSTSRSY